MGKVSIVAKEIYGAKDVVFSKRALKDLDELKAVIKDLPVCIAKTPHSLSGDAKLVGRPENFSLEISRVTISNGAGFFVARTKGINIMPGLNKSPRALHMKYENGEVKLWF